MSTHHHTTNGFAQLLLYAPPAASREEVISVLETYAAAKKAADIRGELPKKKDTQWQAVHVAIKARNLDAVVLRLATGIEAQEQVKRYGDGDIPGTVCLTSLATLLTGETVRQDNEAAAYFKTLLPPITAEHQAFVDGLSAARLAEMPADELRNAVPVIGRKGFALNETSPNYHPYFHALSEKVKGDKELQFALFSGLTGTAAREEITSAACANWLGLHTLLTGESRDITAVRNNLLELAETQGMPLLTQEHRDYVARFDADYVAHATKEALEREIPLLGGTAYSLDENAKTYSPFSHGLARKIAYSRRLQYALFKKCTGGMVASQEQINDTTITLNEMPHHFSGLVTLLTYVNAGGNTGHAESGDYLRKLAGEFGVPEFTEAHTALYHWFDASYVERTPRAQLKKDLAIDGKHSCSISPDSGKYSRFQHALATRKIARDPQLQYALLKKWSGAQAQEELKLNPVVTQLTGLTTRLSNGAARTFAERRAFLLALAEEQGMPLLTPEHQAYLDAFDSRYVERAPAEQLLQELGQFSCLSLQPESRLNYSDFFSALAHKVSSRPELQYTLVRKLARSFTPSQQKGLRILNALLSNSMNLESRTNTHIALLRDSASTPAPASLAEAQAVIFRYGPTYFSGIAHRLGIGERLLGITFFPSVLDTYIHQRKRGAVHDESLDALNVLKLARTELGTYLPAPEYARMVKLIFGGREQLSFFGTEVRDYLAGEKFDDVVVLEQIAADSLQQPLRVRMLLATTNGVRSNDTLDAFVKLYADEDECTADVAFNNFFTVAAGMPGVGEARKIELPYALHLSAGMGSAASLTLSGIHKGSRQHALVTRFRNITTLKDALAGEEPDAIVASLKNVNALMAHLHRDGYQAYVSGASSSGASASGGTALSGAHRKQLEQRMRAVPYAEIFHREISPLGNGLNREYNRLHIGETLDAYRKQHPATIHGDAHHGNLIITEDGRIGAVDFQWAKLGIAQEDLTRYLGRKELSLTLEDERALVADYAEKAGIAGAEAQRIYHFATIHQELKTARIYAFRLRDDYTPHQRVGYDFHLQRMKAHAERVFKKADAQKLFAAAADEFLDLMSGSGRYETHGETVARAS